MKLFLISFIFLIVTSTRAQEGGGTPPPPAETAAPAPPPLAKPLGRVKGLNPPNDSSSFIGDPDNIDPLNPNRDNLKEDAEPVLEDIKSVLNGRKKKKKADALNPPAPVNMDTPANEEQAKPNKPAKVKKKLRAELKAEKAAAKAEAQANAGASLSADDPDFVLEKKFNEIFKRYNINPTPDDVWAAASSKQTARIYEVLKGDTLWSISKILFGDANFWPKLWALNKQGILNPHFINPKMKIYFYEGDEEFAPTLTVGEKAKVEDEKKTPAGAPVKDGGGTPQAAATQNPNDPAAPPAAPAPHVTHTRTKGPSPLPPSLPISRNEDYFGSKQKIMQKLLIDLGKPPEVVINPNNDLIVTDEPAKTDVQIGFSEVAKYRCSDGRLLKDIKFIGTLAAEYDIFERLNDLKTSTGIKYVYRLHGRAVPYQNKYLRAVECRSLIATDLIVVAKGKMKEMNTRKISETPEAVVIGGPDVRDQQIYEKLQYGFVDFGSANFSPGQEYRTISQLTDKVNSEFQIVEKYGSYAVIFFTQVNDTIEIGDKVVNK